MVSSLSNSEQVIRKSADKLWWIGIALLSLNNVRCADDMIIIIIIIIITIIINHQFIGSKKRQSMV